MSRIRELTKGTEVHRYTLPLSIHRDYDIQKVETYLDQICVKWAHEFLEKPEIAFWSEGTIALEYRVSFIVRDPMDILMKGSDFLHEISRFQHEVKVM